VCVQHARLKTPTHPSLPGACAGRECEPASRQTPHALRPRSPLRTCLVNVPAKMNTTLLPSSPWRFHISVPPLQRRAGVRGCRHISMHASTHGTHALASAPRDKLCPPARPRAIHARSRVDTVHTPSPTHTRTHIAHTHVLVRARARSRAHAHIHSDTHPPEVLGRRGRNTRQEQEPERRAARRCEHPWPAAPPPPTRLRARGPARRAQRTVWHRRSVRRPHHRPAAMPPLPRPRTLTPACRSPCLSPNVRDVPKRTRTALVHELSLEPFRLGWREQTRRRRSDHSFHYAAGRAGGAIRGGRARRGRSLVGR